MSNKLILPLLTTLALISFQSNATADPLPSGWGCIGNCGMNSQADGDVSVEHGSYQWVSTSGGEDGKGTLPSHALGIEENGSNIRTPVFSITAGEKLSFYFNYVTSDVAGMPDLEIYSDYAWATLFNNVNNDSNDTATILFTVSSAFSYPEDTEDPDLDDLIIIAQNLPDLSNAATLKPAEPGIIAEATEFSPLGDSSGECPMGPESGCGSTGWVLASYTFNSDGEFSLGFGVTNMPFFGISNDEAYGSHDSALAIAGLKINGNPIWNGTENPIPEPTSLALLGIGLLGFSAKTWRRRR